MMRRRLAAVALAMLAAALWAAACRDTVTGPAPPGPLRATTVVLAQTAVELSAVGDSVQLFAEVSDQNGEPMTGVGVVWASTSPGIARVDAAGLVTAVANGTATVTATAGAASDSATVTVRQVTAAVSLAPEADTLTVGDTLRLEATALDANGHAVADARFAWETDDPSLAVVGASGLVTGVGVGEVEVTATSSGVSGRAHLVVLEAGPASLAVTPAALRLTARGDTARLGVEVHDPDGRPAEAFTVVWTSDDPAVATVDAAGLVTAADDGETAIAARAGPAAGSATVTVAREARTIVVTPAFPALAVGDTLRLAGDVRDRNQAAIPTAAVTWATSEPSVARVDAAGLVAAVATGTATVTARYGAVSGGATVTVTVASDRSALVSFFRSTGGPRWEDRTGWLTDAPLGSWHGVTTDAGGRVIGLELDSNNLVGRLPPQIAHLTRLERMSLADNTLVGPIPPELGSLSELYHLILSRNALDGPIPPELGRLRAMNAMGLTRNRLTGPIPPELGGLESLSWFDLSHNELTGGIPPELAIPGLQSLFVNGNLLHGPVPSALARSGIRHFDFADPPYRNLYLCLPGTPEFVAWAERTVDRDPRYCNESDRAVLQLLHGATAGASWTAADGWLSGPALGVWHGVGSDSLGRVVSLDLAGNGLTGELPARLGHLSALKRLNVADNRLAGRLPASLSALPLEDLRYAGTGLCTPAGASFRGWLGGVGVHEGTGEECPELSDRDILTILYHATDGPGWTHRDNWLTDAPLGEWYGVGVDGEGRVVSLDLIYNNLGGVLPPELGQLARLEELRLGDNPLTGPIPAELARLPRLRVLYLMFTQLTGRIPPELGRLAALEELWIQRVPLTGPIPPELGNLSRLRFLALSESNLTGPIPPELGRLGNLERLYARGNVFTGSLPPELGNLRQLNILALQGNTLTGPIPPELGALSKLEFAWLHDNGLTGALPAELGGLASIRGLFLMNNDLSGEVPGSFGRLTALEFMNLSGNPRMSGPLPRSLAALGRLEMFHAGGTGLCAPADGPSRTWLATVTDRRVRDCVSPEPSRAYLTQAAQSADYPVPLVAGEPALLRVFVTAARATEATIPPVRATFYVDGSEVHTEDIPGGSAAIPPRIEEGELSRSANARIPAEVIRPGLEMVVEIDPDGTLDAELGVQRRIPLVGRARVEVWPVAPLHLTWIPMISREVPDRSIETISSGLTGESPLFWETRTLLPVEKLEVEVHEPVLTSTRNASELLLQVEAIRVMEGGTGYWMGSMANPTGSVGIARTPGFTSVVAPGGGTIAHELGHNLSLAHAPCGGAGAPDPSFPTPNASIGVWGYDFREGGQLVSTARKDLMSYCSPQWISDFSFTRAFRYRLAQAGGTAHADAPVSGMPRGESTWGPSREAGDRANAPVSSLLLWGRLDGNGRPKLEPAFVVDAHPLLPSAGGAYRVSGLTEAGEELFALDFEMREASDGGAPSFVFALPALPEWAGRLARITLSGPAGSASLVGDGGPSMTIVRDPGTGQVRAILRGDSEGGGAGADPEEAARAWILEALGAGLETLHSGGVPDGRSWTR